MGNTLVCALCKFLCRNRCRASDVAASLAFHPPTPPFYRLEAGARGTPNVYSIVEEREAEFVKHPDAQVHMIETHHRSQIPVLIMPFPGSRLVLLTSHGNATDLGSAYNILVDLCINLRINVVAFDYTGYGHATGMSHLVPTNEQFCVPCRFFPITILSASLYTRPSPFFFFSHCTSTILCCEEGGLHFMFTV